MLLPWDAETKEVVAVLAVAAVVAARSFARFVLRRRRGVTVGRHSFSPVDLARSIYASLAQTSPRNVVLILSFFVALGARRLVRRLILDALFGRRPARWVARALRSFFISTSRNLKLWAVGGALCWFAHWRVRVCEKPVVSCARTFWNQAVIERAGLATREFRPVFWLTSRHAQTVLAHVLADLSFLLLRPVRWRREPVALFDGGVAHLDWLVARSDEFAPYGDGLFAGVPPNRSAPAPTSPVVLLLYGVGGTRDDHYMKHLALRCESRGWRAVAFSYWRLDWNEHRDLEAALAQIRAANPAAPIFCVAHSASAFLLVQYLAAVGEATPLVAAVTLAGCMDFLRTAEFVQRTKHATYRQVFLRGMRRCVQRHARHDPGIHDARDYARRVLASASRGPAVLYDRHVASLPRCSHRPGRGSLDGLDAEAPRLARSRPHYVASARERLRDVRIPLLVVHARDDPLVSHDDCYDWADLVRNPRVVAVRTNRGGHNAWHEGLWPLGPSWAVGVATDYVSAVLEQTAQTGWLLAVLRELGGAPSPTAADVARVAAATAPQIEDAPSPPPTPLTTVAANVAAMLFEEDDEEAEAETPPPPPARDPGDESDSELGVFASSLYAYSGGPQL